MSARVEDELVARIRAFKPNREHPVKPYKWILVAAVVVLIHKGVLRSRYLPLDGALRSLFLQLMDLLYPSWPLDTRPRVENPFRALSTEGFWRLVPRQDAHDRLARELALGTWDVLRHVECAEMEEETFDLLAAQSRGAPPYPAGAGAVPARQPPRGRPAGHAAQGAGAGWKHPGGAGPA